LELEPGKYGVFYRTDESHAWGAWNADPPDYPDRWGIALFSLDPDVVPRGTPLHADLETGEVTESVLASMKRLGNGQNRSIPFTLADSSEVSIVAVGEILLSDRYDYGWIARGEEIVWEMCRENTVHAGGAKKNRKAEVTLHLAPGTYTAHFVTDDSHAFGDFSDRPPDNPNSWGMEIRSLDILRQEQEWDKENLNSP
jgi:hypothetical protein